MASRSKTSFEKRRKEVARKEKQKMKAERRVQRKLAKEQGIVLEEPEIVEGVEGAEGPEGVAESEAEEEPVEAVHGPNP